MPPNLALRFVFNHDHMKGTLASPIYMIDSQTEKRTALSFTASQQSSWKYVCSWLLLGAVNCLEVRSCVVLVVNVVEAECTTIVTSSWTSLCLLASHIDSGIGCIHTLMGSFIETALCFMYFICC